MNFEKDQGLDNNIRINEAVYNPEFTVSCQDGGNPEMYKSFMTAYREWFNLNQAYRIRTGRFVWNATWFKARMKAKFGRQQKTALYEYRNWIWTFQYSTSILNVLVSEKGVSWEYDSRNAQPTKIRHMIVEISKCLWSGD